MMRLIDSHIVESAMKKSLELHWPRYGDLQVSHELVPLRAITTAIPKVERERFLRSTRLLAKYREANLPPFITAEVGIPGSASIVLSPFVEVHEQHLVLIDGLHRALSLAASGGSHIWALQIRASQMPPAVGTLRYLSEVTVVDRPIEEAPFFEGRGYDDFRPSDLFTETAVSLIISG